MNNFDLKRTELNLIASMKGLPAQYIAGCHRCGKEKFFMYGLESDVTAEAIRRGWMIRPCWDGGSECYCPACKHVVKE